MQRHMSLRGNIAGCDDEYGDGDSGNAANEQQSSIDGPGTRI